MPETKSNPYVSIATVIGGCAALLVLASMVIAPQYMGNIAVIVAVLAIFGIILAVFQYFSSGSGDESKKPATPRKK
jgi:hypothetical protein